MTSKKKYYLLWKGKETGAFSELEIRRMLKCGEIGLVHKIRVDGSEKYTFVKDFDFSKIQPSDRVRLSFVKSPIFEMLIFVFAGLSFVSVGALVPYFILFFVAMYGGNKQILLKSFAIAVVLSLSGMLFFKVIYPVLIT